MAPLPRIHLLCMNEEYRDAFESAANKLRLHPSVEITHHASALSQLPSSIQFDLVVSPANSHGRLDGGFDDAISRAFSPKADYLALTGVVQKKLYEEWRGFAPPGTCTLVHIPEDFRNLSRNVWGTNYLAICPTMRTPQDVDWDKEVVYECIWSLLCAVDKHNESIKDQRVRDAGRVPIRSILMTPLATGSGCVSGEKWASQAVLALNHFVDSLGNPGKWSSLGWDDIQITARETRRTWNQ